MTTIKFPLSSFYTVGQLPEHASIKSKILKSISSYKQDSLLNKTGTFDDDISKLDWDSARNFERPWVKILHNPLYNYLSTIAKASGFEKVHIVDLWFQQYINNGSHGWHTHGCNFTLVYYLELDENAPRTELIEPYTMSNKIIPKIKEGDVLVFPSYVYHRAPVMQSDVSKTIISANIDMNDTTHKLLQHLSNLE